MDRKRRILELTSPAVFEKTYFRENLQAILTLQKEAERGHKDLRIIILPILVDLKEDTFGPVYQNILKILKGKGIHFFDLTNSVGGSRDSDYWILPFDQHPNEKANEIFAKRLTESFLRDAEIAKSFQAFTHLQ